MHFDDLQSHARSSHIQCVCCVPYLTLHPTCSPITLSVTQDGSTALRTATLQGELAILKLLVQKGADVDATYPVSLIHLIVLLINLLINLITDN